MCASNPKNHIPHEHLIAAFSALVIALSGIILAGPNVSAANKSSSVTLCTDSDSGVVSTKAGSVTQTKKVGSKVVSRTTKHDYCASEKLVVEHFCTKAGTAASRSVPCSKDQFCKKGACINRNTLPSKPPTTTTTTVDMSTEATPNLSIGQWAVSGRQDGTDGTWCQVHSTSTAIAYCEDSRGVKIYSSCDGTRSKIPMCGSVWSGTPDVYLTTKCVFTGYECTNFDLKCGMNGNSATCVSGAPATPTIPPPPSSTPSTTPNQTIPTSGTLPAVVISAESPAAGSSFTQAVLAGTQIARFKIVNNGDSVITVTHLDFLDNGSHTGTSTTYRLYFSDQSSSNYTANTAVSANPNTTFTGFPGFTIDGGSLRYVTVAIHNIGQAEIGDYWLLSVPTLGSARFSVLEINLGYDANLDGDLNDTLSDLPMSGKPIVGAIVKQ